MMQANFQRRLIWVGVFFGVATSGLATRLIWIQGVQHEFYARVAWTNQHLHILRQPRRGNILDAKGNVLARSEPMLRVYANPCLIGPYANQVAHLLAPLINWDEVALAQRLTPTVQTNSKGQLVTNSYVDLRRKLPHEQWPAVTQAMARVQFYDPTRRPTREEAAFLRDLRRYAVYGGEAHRRVYPSGQLAAHVIGFAQEDQALFNGRSLLRLVGRDGIERWFDDWLVGTPGWRETKKGLGWELVALREQDVPARPGSDVVLTVDLCVQQIVESALVQAVQRHHPTSAMALVVRPRTGDILAMATWPTYDPNHITGPPDWRRNRIISDVFEPGSTFKVVTVAAALNERVVTLEDLIDCEGGRWSYFGHTLTDHEGHRVLSVREILTKSSNVGAAKIGVMLGEPRLEQYIRRFGFGEPTGIPLPGEVQGIVHPVLRWDKVMITRVPIGYGVAVTPLQMVMAVAAVANGGELMRPRLVQRIQEPDGGRLIEYPPQPVRQVVSRRVAQDMVAALKTVVARGGTGLRAELASYTVAGKTGTAKKAGPGGYLPGRWFASFVGFFPADDPEVCIGVFLDEPHYGYYGGQTAAPIFKLIAEPLARYLCIKPDRLDNSGSPMVSAHGPGARPLPPPHD
jgi:cell division protein FtsI/penicillin-binding protein 2